MSSRRSHPALAALALLTLGLVPGRAAAREYGAWQASLAFPGIQFRVAYDYFNRFSAREGKPAHVWCLQLRHSFPRVTGFSWAITDGGVVDPPGRGYDWRRNSSVRPGEVIESCIHFLRTGPGGSVRVWIQGVEHRDR